MSDGVKIKKFYYPEGIRKTTPNIQLSKGIHSLKAIPTVDSKTFVVRVRPPGDADDDPSNTTCISQTPEIPSSSSQSPVSKRLIEIKRIDDIGKGVLETNSNAVKISEPSEVREQSKSVSNFTVTPFRTNLASGNTKVKAPRGRPRKSAPPVSDLDADNNTTPRTSFQTPVIIKTKGPVFNRFEKPRIALQTNPVKLVPRRTEPSEALGVADPCCYPPSDRTVRLLNMLAGAEILSIKELAEIVAYITYLRRRKLVTDHLLKESIVREAEEMEPEPDDEPPLVQSAVRFPVKAEKRSGSPSMDNAPQSKMPHLMEVLKRHDNSLGIQDTQWPFTPGGPSSARPMNSMTRLGVKVRPKKVMATCQMCGSRVNEKQMKAHNRTCRGVIVKRRRRGEEAPEEERMRPCPRCDKVLTCDRDFEMHMAVAHKFFWRLDFASESEFMEWFREEGLDETMIAGPSKTHNDIHEKVYYCAINGGARMKVKCPSRLAIKRSANGVVARYSVLHNHAERFVRQQMSNECRDLIISMLKDGLRNYEILKTIKDTYPKSSMNYLVTSQAITRLRYRYHHMEKSPPGKGHFPRRKKSEKPREAPSDFGEEKTADSGGWPLPELQCAAMGISTSFAEQL